MSKAGTELLEVMINPRGVDTSRVLPLYVDRKTYLTGSINRTVIRGLNEERPPFVEVEISFIEEEDEEVFRNSAITGMKFYSAEPPLFSSFLIVAVGDRILAGYIRAQSIQFRRIYKGIDPQWRDAFFVQALNILVYQDGVNIPLYWTGDPAIPMKRVVDSQLTKGRPMMIGNLMVYAHGRIFLATKENLVYASDYIYAQGLGIEKRESVLSFSESAYPSSGDGFGAPLEMGSITGMSAIPESNTLNGYGDIMVWCQNGLFSISPNRKPRNEWTDDVAMQKSILTGKGGAAYRSIASFANQIIYRDSDGGISSMNMDVGNYQTNIALESLSDPVEGYLKYDNNSSDIRYTCSATSKKRLLVSVCHLKERSIDGKSVHRYGMGMVSACLPIVRGNSSMAWEGLWTGVRPTAMVSGVIGGAKRIIISSYCKDQQNRLFYLDEQSKGEDIQLTNRTNIKSSYTYKGVFFNESEKETSSLKSLTYLQAVLIESKEATITATYSVNGGREEYSIEFPNTSVKGPGMSNRVSSQVCSSKSQTSAKVSNQADFFTINVYQDGAAATAKFAVGAKEESSKLFPSFCGSVNYFVIDKLPFDKEYPQETPFSYTL